MKISKFDRFLLGVAPKYAMSRIMARSAAERVAGVVKRHYEAAQPGRRTEGWARTFADADLTIRGALLEARIHARDLIRNNGYARRAQRVIANNTVGWGIMAKPVGASSVRATKAITDAWTAWAGTTECESERRHTFYALQRLAMKTVAESGEILLRRRYRRLSDGLTVPLQIQVLEPDFLDHSRNTLDSQAGGPIIQGIEFDKLGGRAAYWLFPQHPGSGRNYSPAQRVDAADVIHVYDIERPGQSRGISWFVTAILALKDFDEFEDAELIRQKIAACFAAFVKDIDGMDSPMGDPSTDPDEPLVDTFEPGMIKQLPPGRDVTIASPPTVVDTSFTTRTLRRVAAGLGVTYEDLTGDYSQVNFSSARMARIAHYQNVDAWRWDMLIPQLCDGVWAWFMEAMVLSGQISAPVSAEWTPPPTPMLEPDKEGLAIQRLVRVGAKTPDEMVREQGKDPEAHWQEYADNLKRLDKLGIILDSDARKTTAAGQEQAGGSAVGGESVPPEKPAAPVAKDVAPAAK